MPKGDKDKFKADPEDGTTPVANLLLEALTCANLSGKEKSAVLHLWRRTYGWIDPATGKRLKERSIGTTEWTLALGTLKSYVSEVLSSLVEKNIIKRKSTGPGKPYVYSMNTNISQWNSNSINIKQLEGLQKIGTVSLSPNSSEKSEQLHKIGTPSSEKVEPPVRKNPNTSEANSGTGNKDIKKVLNKDVGPTSSEKEILTLLKSLKNWTFKEKEDLEWLRGFMKEFPLLVPEHVKACGDYHSHKPAAHKGQWKNRLRNWMKHEKPGTEKTGELSSDEELKSWNKPKKQ